MLLLARRFAIFAGEGRNESGEIESEIVSGIFVGKAGFEPPEQLVQIGADFGGIGGVHERFVHECKLMYGNMLQLFPLSKQEQFIALSH